MTKNEIIQIKTKDELTMIYMGGKYKLHDMAKIGYEEIGKRMIREEGINKNQMDNRNRTPLMVAIGEKQLEFVKMLLKEKVDTNIKGKNGRTALHWAIQTNQPMMLECLLERGANPKIKDDLGRTPLHCAATLGLRECTYILLRYIDAGIDERDEHYRTPMHYLMRAAQQDEQQNRICHEFIKQGANLNIRDCLKKTPLIYAIQTKKHQCMQTLMTAGATLEGACINQNTVLMIAAQTKVYQSVSLFVKQGISVHHQNRYDESALHLALF
mmetsp:Transcript_2907/g.4218  ORF Transcript_2907/g.4218 Transcript_2907/m.4218 type:complete len:270 (+) Transcript_2907:36-845(+)